MLNVIAQDEGGILSDYKDILSNVFYFVKEKSRFGTLKNEGIKFFTKLCDVLQGANFPNELALEFKRCI